MKKGFTLIELLIVMVIVGILVTVALPKYNASMERGRVTEALTNLQAASDALNTRYLLDDNTYTCDGLVNTENNLFKIGNTPTASLTKSVYFSEPVADCTHTRTNPAYVDVTTDRVTGDYSLTARNQNGEMQYITCDREDSSDAPANICENIGAERDSTTGQYRMDFTK